MSKVHFNAPLLHSTIVAWVIMIIFLFFSVSLAQPDLEVEGIVYEENGQSYAIVNGKIIEVGDKIGKIEVIEISSNAIKFKEGDKIFSKGITGQRIKSLSFSPSEISQGTSSPKACQVIREYCYEAGYEGGIEDRDGIFQPN